MHAQNFWRHKPPLEFLLGGSKKLCRALLVAVLIVVIIVIVNVVVVAVLAVAVSVTVTTVPLMWSLLLLP